MLAPKVIFPKLFLLPRFGVDTSGKWVVNHSPIIRSRYGDRDIEQLMLLAALLNSSVAAWFFDLNGRKFRHGYNEVGVSLLRRFPMPDLGQVPRPVIRRVVDGVSELVGAYQDFDHERADALDDIVLRDLYRLDPEEIQILKPEAYF